MDHVLHSYHVKGKKNFSLYLPSGILCVVPLEMPSAKGQKCFLVSLTNGEVRLYNGKQVVSTLTVDDPVVAMRFVIMCSVIFIVFLIPLAYPQSVHPPVHIPTVFLYLFSNSHGFVVPMRSHVNHKSFGICSA